jgi:hypothetical protein
MTFAIYDLRITIRLPLRRAALKPPQSRRFAQYASVQRSRQRLDCGGFSAAFSRTAKIRRNEYAF